MSGCGRLTFRMAADDWGQFRTVANSKAMSSDSTSGPDPQSETKPFAMYSGKRAFFFKWSENACRALFAGTGLKCTCVFFFEWICDKPQFRIFRILPLFVVFSNQNTSVVCRFFLI